MEKKFKWAAIQPLTGGMYLGCKQAFGTDAEWILSYPLLNSIKYAKDGVTAYAGNDYNLTTYLKKYNIDVPYYTFQRRMFDLDISVDNVNIHNDSGEDAMPNYNDLDLVIAVPVCSGLSMVTKCDPETKLLRNSNMLFISKYTLSVVKPKIYIFENAPTLMGNRGVEIREQLENMAMENGYSVLYYKTDTQYHDNCQRRARTFVIFQRWADEHSQRPVEYGFENIQTDLIEYLSRIPENATQQIPIPMSTFNKTLIDYAKYKFGEKEWRQKSHCEMMNNFILDNSWEDYKSFVRTLDISDGDKESICKFVDHALYKLSNGKNYYSIASFLPREDMKIGSVQFKSMASVIHPTEERHHTIREALHFMGMPHDFELQGDPLKNFEKIGQNVPVRTAYWICAEAKRILENWDNVERLSDTNVLLVDNTNKSVTVMQTQPKSITLF